MTISRVSLNVYNKSNLTLPDPPTNLIATALNAAASIAFTPGTNGGSPITSYTIISNPGNISASGASSPITVSGLTNNITYTFTDIATTNIGNSISSSPSNPATPAATFSAQYLVVAGGGSGGYGHPAAGGSGGGGAGGFLTGNLTLAAGANYTVTVGAGGSASDGSDSVFANITSQGGGKGGDYDVSAGNIGNPGGSGGGGAPSVFGPGTLAGGAGNSSPQQGYNGGTAYSSGSYPCAGGGGGASAAGANAVLNTSGGNGGDGLSSSITGSTVTYAGGGGGAGWQSPNTTGTGGNGGGGNSNYNGAGSPGTVNTGGGGGGGNISGGGAGGSGIVIVSVPIGTVATVANTLTYSSSTVGGNTVYSFTAGTGNISF